MTAATLERRLGQATQRMHEPFAGVLCLDFANTLEPRGGPPPVVVPPEVDVRDELESYDDLVGWALHKQIMDSAVGLTLLALADQNPATAASVLAQARVQRDVIYRTFWSIAHGQPPAAADLNLLMAAYTDAAAHAQLVDSGSSVAWVWPAQNQFLAGPCWPVAHSAVDLLQNGDRSRIKVCPGPGRPPLSCGWLFYDTTRNGSRRWCSMADCGSAIKIQRQTDRRRATRRTSPD
jgi:predicted RNA-binding Zn ribbon-like protein